MNTSFRIPAVIILFTILAAGCQGEKGETGPVGPSGNANVRTFQFTVKASEWQSTSVSGTYYYTRISSSITSNVVSGGAVIVYFQFTPNIWTPIPDNFVSSTGSPFELHYIHGFQGVTGAVQIYLISPSGEKFDAVFKMVVVDGKLEMSKSDYANLP